MIYLIILFSLIINIVSLLFNQFDTLIDSLNILTAILLFLLIFLKNKKVDKKGLETEIKKDLKIEEPQVHEVVVEKNNDKILNEYKELLHIFEEHNKFFTLSVPILNELTKNTQSYEEHEIKNILNRFESIWKESETLIEESENSMKTIFDTDKNTNLGYILQSSRVINKEFNSFMPVLENMNKLADKFVNISLESFTTISQTTKQIEDLAEQVKVISINVRIEAARVKDSGGFKVLGSDITKFADETSDFAKSTNERIQNTLKIIDEMKDELQSQLKSVTDIAKGISHKVNPFETILEDSALSLKGVISKLNRVSGELNHNIKGSLANLQFQDIVRQESDHIIDFLKFYISKVKMKHIPINDSQKKNDTDLIKEILIELDKISTTGNEAIKIEEFCKKWNIVIKDENSEEFNSIDEGTFLF